MIWNFFEIFASIEKASNKWNLMLLNSNFINQIDPKTVWLEALSDEYKVNEPAIPVYNKARLKRLRRMQSQNSIERFSRNVIEIFNKDLRVA